MRKKDDLYYLKLRNIFNIKNLAYEIILVSARPGFIILPAALEGILFI
jgi:hypothetical protein